MLNEFCYRVLSTNTLLECVSQIRLQPNDKPLIYEAGHYVNVLHHDGSVSPLSIACAPNNEGMLEFHLYHPRENLYAQDLLRMANEEKEWKIQGPFGECTANRLKLDLPIIFLAYGTGFAPIKAVIESLPLQVPMYLYWDKDIYLPAQINEWNQRLPHFSFSAAAYEAVLRDHSDLSGYQVYATGPRAYVHAAFHAFQQHGLQRENFFSDMF